MPVLLKPLRSQQFRRIYASAAVSSVGDWIGVLALTLAMLEVTGSVAWSAMVPAALLLPWVGPGVWLTSWLDRRVPRRSVLVGCDLARAAVIGAVALGGPGPVGLLAASFVLGLLSAPFDAARAAVTPDTVDGEMYGTALALSNVTHSLTVVLGYAVGGVAVASLGLSATLWVDAATFVVSALLLGGLDAGRRVAAPEHGAGIRQAVAALTSAGPLRIAVVLAVAAASTRGLSALAAPVGQLLGGEQAAGLLAAGVGVGSMLASMLAPSQGDTRRLLGVAIGLAALGALGPLPLLAAEGSVWAVGAAMVLSGAGIGALVPVSTVFGRELPPALRATGFALALGGVRGMSGLAPMVTGPLAEHVSLLAAGLAVAMLVVAGSGWAWRANLSLPRTVRGEPDAVGAAETTPAAQDQTVEDPV